MLQASETKEKLIFEDMVYELSYFIYNRKKTENHLLQLLDNTLINLAKFYPQIIIMQDQTGKNLGMYAGILKLENSALVWLDNNTAALQQDNEGYNIAMYCAISNLNSATTKALQNRDIIKQRNNKNQTVADLLDSVNRSQQKE